jgi:hypothetical protein
MQLLLVDLYVVDPVFRSLDSKNEKALGCGGITQLMNYELLIVL